MGAASCWLRLRDDCGGGVVKADQLHELMKQGVEVHFYPYAGRFNPSEYYSAWGHGRCTTAARTLLKRGIAKKVNQSPRGHELALVQSAEAA